MSVTPEQAFQYDDTVILCSLCGAPIVVTASLQLSGANGGSVASGISVDCPACFFVNEVRVREACLPPRLPGSQDPAIRAQDVRPLPHPPEVACLWDGESIPPQRVGEAFSTWQGARLLASEKDAEGAEEAVTLALALATHFLWNGKPLEARGILESTLQVSFLPRHRAMLVGALSRYAARSGDLSSARRWAKHLDNGASDLDSDSVLP